MIAKISPVVPVSPNLIHLREECDPRLITTQIYLEKDLSTVSISPNLIGVKLLGNKYEIIEYIDSGGISNVYKAKGVNGLSYAVKILKPELGNTKLVRRIVNEKEIMVKLNISPNLLQLIECGELNHIPYIVTEFADGGSLYSKMQTVSLSALVKYVKEVCLGLSCMHNKGFIHRDIKPQNILIVNGIAKLSDFDLTINTKSDNANNLSEGISGTVFYISPEQAKAENVKLDSKSDIYSLASTLFHVLTGKPPFIGTICEVIEQHIKAKAPNPRDFNPAIPPRLQTTILRALSKDPKDRPGVLEFMNSLI